MRTAAIVLVLLVVAVLPSAAHWTVDTTVPEWCQRGDLHWAIHYGRVTRSDVDLMIKARQNLDHGAGYESDATAAYAAANGVRDLIYICSRTFVVNDYDKHPELKQGVVRAFDGSEVQAYSNPLRRFGCVNCPEWKAFVLAEVDQVQARRHPAGIFFDNEAWFVQCYCPVCRTKFREYTQRLYGREMELPEHPDLSTQVGRAARMFLLDSQTAYHRALLEYCHQQKPRLLVSPNTCGTDAWPVHGIEEGVTDLPFYESSSHPPFSDSLYAYKLYLAAGHGRNVGRLMYLPPAIAAQRGKRVWIEGWHGFEYPSSPLAKEFALGIAEGAATDATYIPNYDLVPSLPITDTKDPFNVGIYQTMDRYYDFLVKNRLLYLNADQGASLAILHSVPTDLWTGAGRRWEKMAENLNRAGVPYEVIVEQDLKADLLARYRAVLVSGVRAISDADAEQLAAYVRGGGRVVFGGECGLTDERGEPHPSPAIRDLRGGAHVYQYDVFKDLELQGLEAEPGRQSLWVNGANPEGRASWRFQGENGTYQIALTMLDENDGASTVSLSVNGKPVANWVLDEDKERERMLSVRTPLQKGDTLLLSCHRDGGEMCRLRTLSIHDVRAEEGLSVGKGRLITLGRDLWDLDGKQLREVVTRLSGEPEISVRNPTGKLSVNVLSQPALKLRTVHLLNYDFTYDKPAGVISDDDQSSEARSYLSDTNWRLRKILNVPDPTVLAHPSLEIVGSVATAKSLFKLVVSLNGADIATLPADQLHGMLSVPVPPERLVKGDNEVALRVEGQPNSMSEWYQVMIDEDGKTGRSFFSQDAGKTWSKDDLSEDRQEQRGEFMIRLTDPDKRPSHLEWESMCHVHPAQGVRVFVAGAKTPYAVALSPTAEAKRIAGVRVPGGTEFAVDVDTYTVLALAEDAKVLQPFEK